jgi:hypothetical protein
MRRATISSNCPSAFAAARLRASTRTAQHANAPHTRMSMIVNTFIDLREIPRRHTPTAGGRRTPEAWVPTVSVHFSEGGRISFRHGLEIPPKGT